MALKSRAWLAVVLLLAAAPLLSACYTAKGAGEDLTAAGQSISKSADNHTNYKP